MWLLLQFMHFNAQLDKIFRLNMEKYETCKKLKSIDIFISREGEQTCDLLSLVALISLRKSFDICIERKRGILDLDALCFQIEQSDRYKK